MHRNIVARWITVLALIAVCGLSWAGTAQGSAVLGRQEAFVHDPFMTGGGDLNEDNIYTLNTYVCTNGLVVHVASQTPGDNSAHSLVLANIKDYSTNPSGDSVSSSAGLPWAFAYASDNNTSFSGNTYIANYNGLSKPVGEEIVGTILRKDHNNALTEDGSGGTYGNGDDEGATGWNGDGGTADDAGPSTGVSDPDGDKVSNTDGSSFDDVLQTDQGVSEGSTTNSYTVAPNPSTSTVQDCVIEKQAPQTSASLTPQTADGSNGWYKSPVTVSLSSHLVYWNGGTPKTYYNVNNSSSDQLYSASLSFGTLAGFGDGIYAIKYYSQDSASPVDSETPRSVSVKVDTAPPYNITTSIHNGDSFDVAPAVPGTCLAQDDTSGLANCAVTNASTDSTSVGSHTLSATATDFAGNQAATQIAYTVLYRWPGFSQPINDPVAGSTTMSQFKAGSTVPVKFQLLDAGNASQQAQATPTFNYQAAPSSQCASTATLESTTSSTGDTSSNYRWDSTSQQYIYNWSTKGLSTGCYQVNAQFSHGVVRSVVLQLK